MAVGIFAGVGGKARKVNAVYIGVGGVARKVKSGYVGVGGVAKRFWPLPQIIGVVDTGERGDNGAVLARIDENFNPVTVNQSYFDSHPLYSFPVVKTDKNYFRKIPIAYWKRGRVPEGKQYAGNWYMLMSELPADGFAASGAVYKDAYGKWKDGFLYGTYRAHNDDGKPGSQPDKTAWGNMTFNTFRDGAASVGDGHHMLSLQEYSEVVGRAVIEKNTFDLWSDEASTDGAHYRGIQDIASVNASGVVFEWRDGVRTGSNKTFEVFADDGTRGYINTGVGGSMNGFPTEWREGGPFDFLFIASSVTSGQANYLVRGRQRNLGNAVCYINLAIFSSENGAFSAHWNSNAGLSSSSSIGGRLAKI
jgi:hypothetical protein